MVAAPRPARSRSRSSIRPSMALMVLLVMVGVSAAACGDLTPPEAYSPISPTTVAPPVDGSDVSTTEMTALSAAAQETDFAPTAEPGYVPALLVAGNRPIFTVDGLDSIPLGGGLAGLQGQQVFDDLGGGLVVQRDDGTIVYRQSQGEDQVLDSSNDAVLLGVGFFSDGSPHAFVRSAPGRVDRIQLVGETDQYERSTHFELGPGEQIVAFSANRDIQAVVVQDAACGELRFYGADGQRLALREPETPDCTFPGRPSFGSVALSPDGGAVAYTIVTYRDDGTEQVTELHALELLTGVRIVPPTLVGEDLDAISSLTYDGQRVAYIRESGGEEAVALLELSDRSELFLDLLGATDVHAVAFTRLPLEIGP